MKLKINQFQELKAVEVEFPAVIRGRNGGALAQSYSLKFFTHNKIINHQATT